MSGFIDQTRKRLIDKLERELGADLLGAINDPSTKDIMANDDGKVFWERFGEPKKLLCEIPPHQARAIVETVASSVGKEITYDQPRIEAEFPLHGARFSGQLPPVTNRAATFCIRRRAEKIFTISDYVEQGVLHPNQAEAIRQAAKNKLNILVSGGTGSGKTTLLNAVIDAVVSASPDDRFIILEDTPEVQCAAEDRLFMYTTEKITMTDLLMTTLRMNPTRILVGEVRDKSALDLLKAWNTGHRGGVATYHSDPGAKSAIRRLETLIKEAGDQAPENPHQTIASDVDVIINISSHMNCENKTVRTVDSITFLDDYRSGVFVVSNILHSGETTNEEITFD